MPTIEEPTDGRRAAKEARHVAFIEQILEIFDEPANRNVTMDDIAVRLGINKVILYRYFGSRDGMFEQIATRWLEIAMERFQTAMAEAELGHRISAGIESYLQMVRERASSYRAIIDHSGPNVIKFVTASAAHFAKVMTSYSPSLAADDAQRDLWAQAFAGAVFQVGDRAERDPSLNLEQTAERLAALLQPGIFVALADEVAAIKPT